MIKAPIHEPSLYKLIILIAGIVIAMFLGTMLTALAFMPSQVITGMQYENMIFLLPLALSAICSASVLAWYFQSYRARSRS